ncbi:MAG: ABC transporter ATP-binding protein [Deltaproteobacteria bacterium]|nr:ABC transporter ATP-binding protein [Deltaproteobacteria bacterium]
MTLAGRLSHFAAAVATQPAVALLDLRELRTSFLTTQGEARAVDGVSLSVDAGKTLGVVGESGCGKTVTALSILRLLPPTGRIVGGAILFDGRNLLDLSEAEMRSVRGNQIAMIFQEPMSSLNPVFTVGYQIGEAVRIHQKIGRREAREKAIEMLKLVEISEPERRVDDYPHQMSGGMRQRIMIAMALSCRPRLLIADEPTTALDVTIQAQILDLLAGLQRRLGMAMILVTHDLGVVAERADEVAIMYAGRVVERAPVTDIFQRPLHPYTRGLLRSIPKVGAQKTHRLEAIPGLVPDLLHLPSGCHFRDRCVSAVDRCAQVDPALEEHDGGHSVACIRARELAEANAKRDA